jgi:soluble lytic murein transglycosylase-like protein
MQIMPRYHRKKIRAVGGTRALFVPEKNIHVGTQILTEYLALSRGNLRRALLRYNGSLGTRSRYADKVMRKYRRFKRVA